MTSTYLFRLDPALINTATTTPTPMPSGGGGLPVLAFSDLTSGPKRGNTDTSLGQTSGQDGAIVSVWGMNLGASQGSSTISVGGVPASRVYYWGNAVPPYSPATLYNAYQKMQVVIFQVSHLAADGPGTITVTVNGATSNGVGFTVRSGNIYFVKASGSDGAAGTWTAPWASYTKANATATTAGDTVYFGDGVAFSGAGGSLSVTAAGTANAPIAFVAYPGAVSQIGSTSVDQPLTLFTTAYRTWAKLAFVGAQTAVYLQEGGRFVGSTVSAPNGNTPTGAMSARGNNLVIYGNEFTNCGNSTNGSYLYHTLYVSGYRQGVSNPAQTSIETDRDVGWNYFHHNHATRAINIYTEAQSGYSDLITGHHVHHNLIVDQTGDGILIGNMVVGENWITNNLIVRAGQAVPGGDVTQYVGINLRGGVGQGSAVGRVMHVYNNTLVDIGYVNGTNTGGFLFANTTFWTPDIHNNIVYQTNRQPYVATGSDTMSSGFSNNLWYGNGPAPAFDVASVNTDPAFTNATTPDLHLTASSPAINAGLAGTVTDDFDWVSRPQGGAIDIGAYEYISNATPIPTPTRTGQVPNPQRPTPPALL